MLLQPVFLQAQTKPQSAPANRVEAAITRGFFALESGNLKKGKLAFSEAAKLLRQGGNTPQVIRQVFQKAERQAFEKGRRLVAAGDFGNAIKAFKSVIIINPAHTPSYLNLGIVYFSQKENLDLAIAAFAKAAALRPQMLEPHLFLAQAYFAKNLLGQAEAESKRVIEIDPKNAPAHYVLGLIYERQGNRKKALLSYKQTLSFAGKSPEAKQAEARIAKLKKEVEIQFQTGLRYMQEKKFDAGKKAFEAVLLLDPSNAHAFYNLAIIFSQTAQIEKAISAFKVFLKKVPDFFHARLLLAQSYERQGSILEAIIEYRRVLSEVPDQKQREAIQARQKLSQLGMTPETGAIVKTQLDQAESLLAQGDLKGAKKAYKAVLRVLPTQLVAYFKLGLIALQQKKIDAAEQQFLKAIKIDPNHYPSHLRLGAIYENQVTERPLIPIFDTAEKRRRLSAFDKAVSSYKKASEVRPQDAFPYLRLGVLYEKMGRNQEAVVFYRKASALSAEASPANRFTRGRIDYYEKRFHLNFNDAFVTIDDNRRRSAEKESELSSNLTLGLSYYLRKTTRIQIPLQLTIQNSLLHRSQLFFNNEDLSLNLITTSASGYTFSQGYRLSYGFSGGSGVPNRSSYLNNTVSSDIIRRGRFPSQTVLHVDLQSFQAKTNPVFDATRKTASLSLDQQLTLYGKDRGRLGVSYRFLDNNVAASDQANRSKTLSFSYGLSLSSKLRGGVSLSETHFKYRHPDSLAISEEKIRFRKNRLKTWSVDLTYMLQPGVSFFTRYLNEENSSNLPSAEPLDLVSLNSGQAASLGAYQRTVISAGVRISTDLYRPYPKWAKLGKHLRVGLTTGYYRPSLKSFHETISNPRLVIIQDPNHLLPTNPDFRSELRNLKMTEMGGALSTGLEVEWEVRPRHSLVFNLSEWQNSSVGHDMIPLLLSSAAEPEIVPRSARYNLVVNHYLLTWRYTAWQQPKQGRLYLNIGLVGGAFANLTMDSLVKISDPPIGNPFASLGSSEARGKGFTSRFGFGGEYFLTSWLSISMNANYLVGTISKLKVERGFRADFRLIPPGLPGVENNPCFRQIERETEGEVLQVATCNADQQVEGTSLKNVVLKLDGFEARGALLFHFGAGAPIETSFDRFLKKHRLSDNRAEIWKRFRSRLEWSGSLKNETAYRFVEPVSFTKMLNLLRLNATWSFGSHVHLKTRFRGFYDAIYDVVDIDSVSPRRFPNTVLTQLPQAPTPEQIAAVDVENSRDVNMTKQKLEFREVHLNILTQFVDFRIGRQIARWGVVEGARVTDELNPFDFSEFILRDVEDRFIPLMMVKTDIYVKKTTLELIWIPEIVPHKQAPKGSEFEQFEILPGFVAPESFLDSTLTLKEDAFENSEAALRLLHNFSGWELSISGFYTWDDFPSTFRTIEGGVGGGFQAPPTVTFTPRQKRLKILGTTLSKSFGQLVLNSEFAYTFGKFFGTRLEVGNANPIVELGELQRDFIKYAVGLNFAFFGMDTSLQFLQQRIFDWEKPILQDRIDTVTSIFARKSFLNNRLGTQLLVLYFINESDFLLRPRLDTSLTDKVKLRWGADLFIGDRGERVGEFDFIGFFKDSDRLYIEVIYSF